MPQERLMASPLDRKAFSYFDGLLIAFLFFLSISGMVYMDGFFSGGDSIKIEVNGKVYGVYPLSVNRVFDVEGPLGKTVIEVKDRRVRVVSSPCPNKLCIHQGFVRAGSIICLPNRVVITIGVHSVDGITG